MSNNTNLWRILLLTSAIAATCPAAYAQGAEDDNMVTVPMETPMAAPQPNTPQPVIMPEDNMVLLPDPGAVQGTPYVPITSPSYVEAGVSYFDVNNDYGNQFGQFITGQYQSDAWNRWNATLLHQEAFKDDGWSLALGNNHTFNEDWFSDVGIAFGTSASYQPSYRADASINRRLENFIATAGLTYINDDFGYSSIGGVVAGTYYFQGTPLSITAGSRLDFGRPGNVASYSPFVAATYGYAKRYYLTARYSWAHEAYQILGSGSVINKFNSNTVGLNWRQWIGDDWGFNLGTEYYTNPAYHRVGGTASFFKEF